MGWANELHPYPPEFMALAQKFLAVLRQAFSEGRDLSVISAA